MFRVSKVISSDFGFGFARPRIWFLEVHLRHQLAVLVLDQVRLLLDGRLEVRRVRSQGARPFRVRRRSAAAVAPVRRRVPHVVVQEQSQPVALLVDLLLVTR